VRVKVGARTFAGRRAGPLGRADGRDLRAHHRAIDQEEAQHRQSAVVACRLQVAVEEALREVHAAAVVEVHHRERDLGHDVDPAQRRTEFDAVEHDDAIVVQHDVGEMQVAVAFAHEAAVAAVAQKRRDARVLRERPLAQRRDAGREVRVVLRREHVIEVGDRVRQRDSGCPPRVGHGRGGRATMKASDQACQLVDALGRQPAFAQQPVEFQRAIEAPHAHRVLEHGPIAADLRLVRGAGHGHDIEVEFRREPAIQPHLLFARRAPPGERREVEKSEVEGLFQLVGIVAGEDDPRDVRLDLFDMRCRVGKTPALAQAGNQRRERVQDQPVCFGARSGNR
jgi:hypothetical protein